MKITDVKSFSVWQHEKNLFIVKVETDEGIYGVGEAGLTWKELAVAGAMEHLGELIIGEEKERLKKLKSRMQEKYKSLRSWSKEQK